MLLRLLGNLSPAYALILDVERGERFAVLGRHLSKFIVVLVVGMDGIGTMTICVYNGRSLELSALCCLRGDY